jgi:hypothetical protein
MQGLAEVKKMLNEGLSKEQFNGATGGLISIDEDDDINIESQTFQRVWRFGTFNLFSSFFSISLESLAIVITMHICIT